MSVPTKLERCEDAVVWWWPELKVTEWIPSEAVKLVEQLIVEKKWIEAWEEMTKYLEKVERGNYL
jgi:hypothetical protein